ncbi:hypothetical protein BJX99DRAFT_264318 [Aspergillus californicus]
MTSTVKLVVPDPAHHRSPALKFATMAGATSAAEILGLALGPENRDKTSSVTILVPQDYRGSRTMTNAYHEIVKINFSISDQKKHAEIPIGGHYMSTATCADMALSTASVSPLPWTTLRSASDLFIGFEIHLPKNAEILSRRIENGNIAPNPTFLVLSFNVATSRGQHAAMPGRLYLMAASMASGITTSIILETVLLKHGADRLSWPRAARTAMGMSLVSMLAMEAAENAVDYHLTGGVVAFHEPQFWLAAAVSIGAGFLAPLPYNYLRLRKYGKACH